MLSHRRALRQVFGQRDLQHQGIHGQSCWFARRPCLSIQGHAVFVEDAIEMNNVIHRNLVVLTR